MDPRIVKLNEFAKHLFQIAESLDDSGEGCECCGAYRRNDWVEYQLRQKVEGAVVTLSNLALAFEDLPNRKARFKGTPGQGPR